MQRSETNLSLTRRQFLASTIATSLFPRVGFSSSRELHIGVTDWCLSMESSSDALRVAASLGFDGLQISLGSKREGGRLLLDNPESIARYRAMSKQYGIAIDGTSVDQSHPLDNPWVLDSIRLTAALGATVLELPFFGPSEIKTKKDLMRTGDVLRDLAIEARNAGIILGLENTLSAEDSVQLIEQSRSSSVQVYYDVGNAVARGFDPVKEIRWLGKERICQFHFKDNPHYLGRGKIGFAPIVDAIRETGFSGYANLETDSPSGKVEADVHRNLMYIRNLMGKPH